jgi:hypothetical protein
MKGKPKIKLEDGREAENALVPIEMYCNRG